MGVIGKSISLTLLALLLSGCAPRFDFEGTWVGRRDLSDRKDVGEDVRVTLERVNLSVKGSRFDLFEAGVPKSGRVGFGSDRATLIVDTIMGRRASEELQVEVRGVSKDKIELLAPIPVMLVRETHQQGGP